jgi:hypothetical protein
LTEHATSGSDGRLRTVEKELAELKEANAALWHAVTALSERVAEATQAEEIIRRARAE